MRISDWSSDVCSSDLCLAQPPLGAAAGLLAVGLAQCLHGGGDLLAIGAELLCQQRQESMPPGRVQGQIGSPEFGGARPCRHLRSEERRVGKEWVRTCRSQWSP